MSFTYDNYGNLASFRENGKDGKWLQKDYTYASGNVNSTTYTSQSGELAIENYYYSNGHLSEVRLNGTTPIFKLNKENALGQPTEVATGKIKRKYDYTPYGMQSGQSAMDTVSLTGYQNISYNYDVQTSNLLSRTDSIRNFTESFGYDNMNRLISYGDETATYDIKGNITEKSDIGSFSYGITSRPYALSGATPASNAIQNNIQEVIYTSFNRPMDIMEGIYTTDFDYNSDHDRIKMRVFGSQNSPMLTRHYLGGCYEFDQTPSNAKEKLYLMGGYYNAPAVLIKQGDSIAVYNILRDHLASITHVIDPNGVTIQELAYDAWGRLRNPVTHEVYSPGQEPELFLGRGFTGHEHLPWYGLINMNARLYDPALGRFLSPDPILFEPDNSQSYNSYTYCLNNPLRYVDLLGLFKNFKFKTEWGEIATMIWLNEIVVTPKGNFVIEDSQSTGFGGGDGLNLGIGDDNWNNSWWNRWNNTMPSDPPSGGVSVGKTHGTGDGQSDGSLQLSFYNIPPKPIFNDPNLSDIINATSLSASYLAYTTADSKMTYGFVYQKSVDYPILKVSKEGNRISKIAKTHKVSTFFKKGAICFGVVNSFYDLNELRKAYVDKDWENCLKKGIDFGVDVISLIPGPIPLVIGITWGLYKDDVWNYLESSEIGIP